MKRPYYLLTLIVGAVIALLLSAFTYYGAAENARVVAELRNNPQGMRAEIVMLLTFQSGRELPVNYLREGNQVFVGADGRWWREFRTGNVPVTLLIQGQEYSGRARTVMDNAEYTRDVFQRLRPNVPKWLPDWLDAYLIVIDLDV